MTTVNEKIKFCGQDEKEFLKNYNANDYDRPSVTVDILLFTIVNGEQENYRTLPEKQLKVLFVKRAHHPFMGKWALPGGFVGIKETLNDTAYRVLKEEANVDRVYLEQLYTWGEVDRDPRTRVISSSYMSLVNNDQFNIQPGNTQNEAQWFNLKSKVIKESRETTEQGEIREELIEISFTNKQEQFSAAVKKRVITEKHYRKADWEIIHSDHIAFDHAKIIQYGIERLKNKLEYTDTAFNLMNEKFTLTELQQVYETILDKPLLKANFRRKIANMVIETSEYTKDAGHRPSKLYVFNTRWHDLDGI
ncbi:NUDIX hydrolase [Geosporobacter ferrireducens]|uniref:ADP-ribose pyrophosphatase n=1 Tax=Geosporobacter ferrireducens TaxID=1424294 RepID=A0A1D8GDM4_9FIRM|nr:NUDIX domain-containing protein [Geosporobacter ferrireducens]AOT69001.1 ADP-ribose pyrophosphatase [Geosporobacter ferrireducens]MTI58330.1 NUDIX hydrolase [Geosporobacter ferrireducens]